MIDDLFALSQSFLRLQNRSFQRYFLKSHPLSSRFSLIVGQRGVGKTTVIIQHILATYQDLFTPRALYVQTDHFRVASRSLYDIAEEFNNLGGELLCLDEVHKYPVWSMELKSIYDTFPRLKIIASGSSALDITRGSHDLSRRAVVYTMTGMSFREFISLLHGLELPVFSMQEILENHQRGAGFVIDALDKKNLKILSLFKTYLQVGYYPYFMEYQEQDSFYLTLEQNLRTTLETDLIAAHNSLSGASIRKIKKLLAAIATQTPFTPDMKKLKAMLEIGDERTLKLYLQYLEEAGLILMAPRGKRGFGALRKPEKIYLNNPTLIHALALPQQPDQGSLRETFFFNMIGNSYPVSIPRRGDFLVDDRLIFEIGGKNKDFQQIKDLPDAFLAVDDIESGYGARIPLWLFGFLY